MLKVYRHIQKNIEESYCIKITEMFEKNYSFQRMFKELAATDWECYKYFKNRLKEVYLRKIKRKLEEKQIIKQKVVKG